MSSTKIKSGIWAAGVAAIVAVGTLTGASMKEDSQKKERIKEFRETTNVEQIALLEDRRKHLVSQKAALQRKIDAFHDTVKEREDKVAKRRDNSS